MYGALEPVWEERHNLMAYYRRGERTLLIVGNYQKEAQEIQLPANCQKVLLNNYREPVEDGPTIRLQGYQVLVLEM